MYSKFSMDEQSLEVSIDSAVSSIRGFGGKNVIATGGEPLLQQHGLQRVFTQLRKLGPDYRFEIETNGTLVPDPSLDALVSQYNCSPKLENSKVETTHRLRDDALKFFAASEKAVFKFVVSSASDLDEVQTLAERFGITAHRILLMPEGTSSRDIHARLRTLVEPSLRLGYRLSDRLHVHLFGNERGT